MEEKVRRSVFTKRAVEECVKELPGAYDDATLRGVPNALARVIRSFSHYYRVDTDWFMFRFLGPGPREREGPVARHANYYFAVVYEPIELSKVPFDRRYHRPAHLLRHAPETPLHPSLFRSVVPIVTAGVIGRGRDISRILRVGFARRAKEPVAVSLQGLPGVGKTEVVALLSNAITNRYRDGHLYLSAGSEDAPRSAEDVLRDCLIALEHDVVDHPRDLPGLAARYRALLCDRAFLVICENVVTVEQVAGLMPTPGSALVVTSRTHIVLPDATRPIVIAPLRAQEATSFLQQRVPETKMPAGQALRAAAASAISSGTPTAETSTIAEVIAALAGCLPLALRICERYLVNHPDVDASAFARAYVDEQLRLRMTGARGETLSVEASFNVSYRTLDADEQRVFRALGIFPGSFPERAARAVTADVPNRALPIISDLVQRGLVTWNAGTRRYVLHELLRAFALTRLDSNERSDVLHRLIEDYHGLGAHRIKAFLGGNEAEITAADRELEEELPTISAVVSALLRVGLESRDALYACSDLVLGYAPLLLGRAPDLLREWSAAIAEIFWPLASKQYRHPHLPVHRGSRELVPSPYWGLAAQRWLYHRYHGALAVEQVRTDDADDAAALATYELLTGQAAEMATDAASAWVLKRAHERRTRLLRRNGSDQRAVFSSVQRDQKGRFTFETVERLLDLLVTAHAAAVAGNFDEARSRARDALRATELHDDRVPWEAAFYLDTLAEVPATWQRAYLRYAEAKPGWGGGPMLAHFVTAARGEIPPDFLASILNFFARSPRPTRVASPVLAGIALAQTSRREAFLFFGAAIKVAEQMHDMDGLLAALIARVAVNDAIGSDALASQDRLRLRQLYEGEGYPATASSEAIQIVESLVTRMLHSEP